MSWLLVSKSPQYCETWGAPMISLRTCSSLCMNSLGVSRASDLADNSSPVYLCLTLQT